MDHSEPSKEPDETQKKTASFRIPRPFSVTILACGVLIITVINLVRLILSIRNWGFLASLPGVSPIYIAISGFIWTLAGATLLWGLWRAKAWAPRLMQAVALTYALYYWLDVVFLEAHPLGGAVETILLPVNWPFAAGITVVCLAYMAWTLGRRKVRAYFNPIEAGAVRKQSNDESGSFQERGQ